MPNFDKLYVQIEFLFHGQFIHKNYEYNNKVLSLHTRAIFEAPTEISFFHKDLFELSYFLKLKLPRVQGYTTCFMDHGLISLGRKVHLRIPHRAESG